MLTAQGLPVLTSTVFVPLLITGYFRDFGEIHRGRTKELCHLPHDLRWRRCRFQECSTVSQYRESVPVYNNKLSNCPPRCAVRVSHPQRCDAAHTTSNECCKSTADLERTIATPSNTRLSFIYLRASALPPTLTSQTFNGQALPPLFPLH
jgi:hypothetical protein